MNMTSEEKDEVPKGIQELDEQFPGHYIETYKNNVGCPFQAALGDDVTPPQILSINKASCL
ncbi:hypothetical protein [Pseudomonas sp. NPDC087336]|uniref:hypothetical protein n=1 Tax=Pseudomonas sp. NPDC087336 TaxID=3364436 RepID=UPI00382119CC